MKLCRITIHFCLTLCGIILLTSGCTLLSHDPVTEWMSQYHERFPNRDYLVGLGQGNSYEEAEARGYAAVAKIFSTEIRAHARDWATYRVESSDGHGSTYEMQLDHLVEVSTKKVLTHTRVLEWVTDPSTEQVYVLVGLHRPQAEVATIERIREFDKEIKSLVEALRKRHSALDRIRHIARAIRQLLLREVANTDLRVIRKSGEGIPSIHAISRLKRELEMVLMQDVIVQLDVTGVSAPSFTASLASAFTKAGIKISEQNLEVPTFPELQGERLPVMAHLLVQGTLQIERLSLPDPRFSYVRWAGQFQIIDADRNHVIGAISESGKEGHVSEGEAINRAKTIRRGVLIPKLVTELRAVLYGSNE